MTSYSSVRLSAIINVRATTESRGFPALYSISHRNNNIKIIILNILHLSISLFPAIFLSDSSFLGLMKVNESGICNSFSLSEDIEVSHCDFRAQMEKENFSYVLKHFADEIDDRTFVDKVVALYEKGNDFVIKELNKKLIDSINRLASSKKSVDIVMKAMEVSDKEEREKIVRKIKEYTNNLYGL